MAEPFNYVVARPWDEDSRRLNIYTYGGDVQQQGTMQQALWLLAYVKQRRPGLPWAIYRVDFRPIAAGVPSPTPSTQPTGAQGEAAPRVEPIADPAYYAHRLERSLDDFPDKTHVALHRDFLAETAATIRALLRNTPVAQGEADSDAAMLDWLLPRISGKAYREAGVTYSGGVGSIREAIRTAMKEAP